MSIGPWDVEAPTGPTEYGGSAGVVQPGVTPQGTAGHTPTASEENNMIIRGGMHYAAEEFVAGVDGLGREVIRERLVADSIDPVTGLEVPLQ